MDCGRLLSVCCSLMLCCVCTSASASYIKDVPPKGKISFHLNTLFLQPNSNNLIYAVFVSGNQPTQQSWHNQAIIPDYSPGFELGVLYTLPQSDYGLSVDWLYLNANTSSSKQASLNTNPLYVQFVAPPYDVGPAVFGIKRANSTVNFDFNSVLLNVGRVFEYFPHVRARLFGGVNIVRINQTLTTTFSDYAGSPQILSQAYALPPDPSFNFQTNNTSEYLGVGPDLGINVQYEALYGFGVVGQFMGTLTAGSISVNDSFTSASSQLMAEGVTKSHQSVTAPNMMQVVPGFDSKLGLFYNHSWRNFLDLMIEAGYRFAYYSNAISIINPATLVQAKLDTLQPEFATGTMAINSTNSTNSSFNLNGPYINLTLSFNL